MTALTAECRCPSLPLIVSWSQVPTLSASGSLPVNQVSLQLPSFTRVPVQAYCYDGEVATLSVAGGDSVQLRGLPYQLNQLSSALKKAQGEAEAMRGLKAAEVARLEFGNMSVKSVETQGGHMGGGATAAEMFLQFVRDNQYFEVSQPACCACCVWVTCPLPAYSVLPTCAAMPAPCLHHACTML